MNNDISTQSDYEQVKSDLQSLFSHTGALITSKTQDAKQKWDETRVSLEKKKEIVEAKASELAKAGSAATAEMKSGFGSALQELKDAFKEAKSKFDN